jgi:hypothetical protein
VADILPRKITGFLQPVKDDPAHRVSVALSVSMGMFSVNKTGFFTETRFVGHCHIRLYLLDKSAFYRS